MAKQNGFTKIRIKFLFEVIRQKGRLVLKYLICMHVADHLSSPFVPVIVKKCTYSPIYTSVKSNKDN